MQFPPQDRAGRKALTQRVANLIPIVARKRGTPAFSISVLVGIQQKLPPPLVTLQQLAKIALKVIGRAMARSNFNQPPSAIHRIWPLAHPLLFDEPMHDARHRRAGKAERLGDFLVGGGITIKRRKADESADT